MSVAEKLLTVAENTPKVCEVVNSAMSDASGEVLTVKDVAAVEHDAVVRLRSKNYFNTRNPKTSQGIGKLTIISDNAFHITSNGTSYSKSQSFYVYGMPKKANMTISYLLTVTGDEEGYSHNRCYVYGINEDGSVSSSTDLIVACPTNAGNQEKRECSYTFNTSEYIGVRFSFYITLGGTNCELPNYEATLEDIQIEQGNTATDYTPYIENFSAAELTRLGKNWFYPTEIAGYVTRTEISDDLTTVKVIGLDSVYRGYSQLKMFLKAGTYTISYKVLECTWAKDGDRMCMVGVWGKPNAEEIVRNYIVAYNFNTRISGSFTVAEDREVYVAIYPYCFVDNYAIVQIQIERGSTATEYEQPVVPTTYTAAVDGTVEGVKSLSPSMTLYTGAEGTVIDCRYFPQGQESIAETFSAIKDGFTGLRERIGGDTDVH